LLRIIAGDLTPDSGAVTRDGGLGVMRQFVGSLRDSTTLRDLLVSVAPPSIRLAAQTLEAAELAMMEHEDEPTQMRYAQALSDWADAGGYEAETLWDVCTTSALGMPFERRSGAKSAPCPAASRSAWYSRRCCVARTTSCCSTNRTTISTSPASAWLEERLAETPKTVLLVSHDRELRPGPPPGSSPWNRAPSGASAWVHGAGFASYRQARRNGTPGWRNCAGAGTRTTPNSRPWC
jgi:hypothetical protein